MSDFWAGHLKQRETLLWTGKPNADRQRAVSSFRISCFFIFIATTCFWIIFFGEPRDKGFYYAAIEAQKFAKAYVAAWILGPPAALLGLFYPQFRLFLHLRGLRYGLTDRRAIIATAKGKIIREWFLDEHISPWQEPDSVQFGNFKTRNPLAFLNLRGRRSGKEVTPLGGFEMIPDATQVYELTISAMANLKNTRQCPPL